MMLRQALGLFLVMLLLAIPSMVVMAYSDQTVDIDREKWCDSDGPCNSWLWVYRENVGTGAWVNVTHTGSASGPWEFDLEVYNVKNLTVDVETLYDIHKAKMFADTTTLYSHWLNNRYEHDLKVTVNSTVDLTDITLIMVPEPLEATFNGTPIDWTYDDETNTLTSTYPEQGEGIYEMWFVLTVMLKDNPEDRFGPTILFIIGIIGLLIALIFLKMVKAWTDEWRLKHG